MKTRMKKLTVCMLAFLMSFSCLAYPVHAEETGNIPQTSTTSANVASVTVNGTTTYYSEIEKAFEYVNGKTATITILNDITLSEPLLAISDSNSNVTIDLNGKTITGDFTGNLQRGVIDITGGTATIQNGTLCQKGDSHVYTMLVRDSNVTVSNIECMKETGTGVSFKVDKNSAVTINSGNFYAGTALNVDGINGKSTVTINNGTFDGGIALQVRYGEVIIKDGTFKCTNTASTTRTAIYFNAGGKVTIEGGTFTGGNSILDNMYTYTNVNVDGVTIKGGTFTGTLNDYAGMVTSNANVGRFLAEGYVGYDENGDIIYTKDTNLFGINVTNMTVAKEMKESAVEITTPSLDKKYDGKAVNEPSVTKTGSTKEVTFTWYQEENGTWKQLEEAPVNAGSYKVIASVEADESYKEAADEMEFTISQAGNEWTEELSIKGWASGQYDEKVNVPTAQAKFGEAVFTYSKDKDGIYTANVPTETGTWYVKATVAETENYAGLEAVKEFAIKAKEMPADTQKPPKDNGTQTAAQTSDTSNLLLWGIITVLSALALSILCVKRKKIK